MINKSDKILVTGGTGFLGSYLLRYLVDNGYTSIVALKRVTSRMDLVEPIKTKVEWVEGDILDLGVLEDVISRVDYVFHCAAMVSFFPKDAKRMSKVNVEGTANLVNLSLEYNIKKFIHVSSTAAVGRRKKLTEIDEKTNWESSDYNSRYAITKFLSEQEVWRGQAEGLNIAIVNPSVIMGSGFWNEGPAAFFKMVWNGLKFYSTGKTGFVDVRDVAKFMILLLESDIEGERYILNGQNLDFRYVFNTIALHLGVKKPSIKVTPFLEAISWRLLAIPAFFTGKAPAITKETAQSSGRIFLYDNSKSKSAFNFKYTDIENTIKESAYLFKKAQKYDLNHAFLPLN